MKPLSQLPSLTTLFFGHIVRRGKYCIQETENIIFPIVSREKRIMGHHILEIHCINSPCVCSQWMDNRRKYNIQGNIKILLESDC